MKTGASVASSSLPSSIAVFEDRHFTFGAIKNTIDVFLVRKNHQQCYRNREDTVERNIIIKYKQDKNSK